MIARTQHHLFQPLLYQVATGILSEGEIAPATRRTLRNQRNAEVLLGDVMEINLAGRYVVSEALGLRYETAYDSLIVAAGAGQSYFGNHHFAEFAPGMKTIDDALEVRRAGDLAHLHPGERSSRSPRAPGSRRAMRLRRVTLREVAVPRPYGCRPGRCWAAPRRSLRMLRPRTSFGPAWSTAIDRPRCQLIPPGGAATDTAG